MADRIVYDGGTITLGGGKVKYLLLPKSIFGAIYKGLDKVLGPGASATLYIIGREFGEEFAEEMRAHLNAGSHSHDMVGVSKVIADMFMKLGFGKIEVVEASDKHIVIRAYETPTTDIIKHADKPVCHIERGILAGVLSVILGKHVRTKETSCRATGSKYCEFVAEI